MSELPAPGIYFGLDEAIYHAAPALSNSGIKHLMISPMDFWARCQWLNPDFEYEQTDFMALGTAYDIRITEGRKAFYERYAAALEADDYPDALRTIDDLRGALRELCQKAGGNKRELIDRLIDADAGMALVIWDVMLETHAEQHKGKILLPMDTIKRIEIAAAMIEKHPQLCKAFTGGYAQVSIFWTCEETGCPMKARLDYLKTQAIVDLKTFSNPHGKPIDRAVTYAMASQKYHIQAAVYQEAVEAAKDMIRKWGMGVVNSAYDARLDWISNFVNCGEHHFLFLFQQTGIAPVARGFEFPKGTVFDCGKIVVREMKQRYVECMERFGTDPWIDVTDVRAFDDTEFPVFIVE